MCPGHAKTARGQGRQEKGNLVGAVGAVFPKEDHVRPEQGHQQGHRDDRHPQGMLRSASLGLRFQFLAFGRTGGGQGALVHAGFARLKLDHDGLVAD